MLARWRVDGIAGTLAGRSGKTGLLAGWRVDGKTGYASWLGCWQVDGKIDHAGWLASDFPSITVTVAVSDRRRGWEMGSNLE